MAYIICHICSHVKFVVGGYTCDSLEAKYHFIVVKNNSCMVNQNFYPPSPTECPFYSNSIKKKKYLKATKLTEEDLECL